MIFNEIIFSQIIATVAILSPSSVDKPVCETRIKRSRLNEVKLVIIRYEVALFLIGMNLCLLVEKGNVSGTRGRAKRALFFCLIKKGLYKGR